MEAIFNFLMQPEVLGVLGVIIGTGVSILCTKFGWFASVQPLALQALKAVEAAVPDNSEVKAIWLINRAMQVYIAARESQGKKVSEAEQAKALAAITAAVENK